jgi:hypothetical protein
MTSSQTTADKMTQKKMTTQTQEYWNALDKYVEMKHAVWRLMNDEERREEFESDGSKRWVEAFYRKMAGKYGVKFVKCP